MRPWLKTSPPPTRRRRRFTNSRMLLVATAFITLAGMLWAASGVSDLFSVPEGSHPSEGEQVAQALLDSSSGTAVVSDCSNGQLMQVTPVFARIVDEPMVGGTTIGVADSGESLCALGRDDSGWWQVEVPYNPGVYAWVTPETFATQAVAQEQQQPIEQEFPSNFIFAPKDSYLSEDSQEYQPTSVQDFLLPPADSAEPSNDGSFWGSNGGTNDGGSGECAPVRQDDLGGSGIFGGGAGTTGTSGIIVKQSLLMKNVVASSGLGIVSDDGTRFTVAVETTIGSTFAIRMIMENASNSPLSGRLQLVSAPGTIDVTFGDGVTGLQRLGEDLWIFTMKPDHSNALPDISIEIKTQGDGTPGFRELTGCLWQTAA